MSDDTRTSEGLRLSSLRFLGADGKTSSIGFGPRLTTITGPSNTGKSFVLKSIDFVLGKDTLPAIPQLEGYTSVELDLEDRQGRTLRLRRELDGGDIRVVRDDLLTGKDDAAVDLLRGRHDPLRSDNISRFMLRKLSLDGVELVDRLSPVRKRLLSLRELLDFALIEEERMIHPRTPIEPRLEGFRVTLDRSLFKLLVTGVDDASVPEEEGLNQKETKLRLDTIKEMIDRFAVEVEKDEGREETELRVRKVEEGLAEVNQLLGTRTEERQRVNLRSKELQDELREQRLEHSRLGELSARFDLLAAHYASDIDRLEMVREAGNFLALFDMTVCPVCGAAAEHQHPPEEVAVFGDDWDGAVSAEIAKTRRLADDLTATLVGLADLRNAATRRLEIVEDDIRETNVSISALDQGIKPLLDQLQQLTNRREHLLRVLGTYGHLEYLESLQEQTKSPSRGKKNKYKIDVDATHASSLVSIMREYLMMWEIPYADTASISFTNYEIILGGQPRADNGEGVRSILHAAFSLALSHHGHNIGLAVPGFLVLDTPILTYRPSDLLFDTEVDATAPRFSEASVTEAFYNSLLLRYPGQCVVIENTEPPDAMPGVVSHHFTGIQEGGGRQGLL